MKTFNDLFASKSREVVVQNVLQSSVSVKVLTLKSKFAITIGFDSL